MVSAAEELNFTFYVISTNLNLDSNMGLVAIVLDSTNFLNPMKELDSDHVSELETPGGGDCYLQDSEHNLLMRG